MIPGTRHARIAFEFLVIPGIEEGQPLLENHLFESPLESASEIHDLAETSAALRLDQTILRKPGRPVS